MAARRARVTSRLRVTKAVTVVRRGVINRPVTAARLRAIGRIIISHRRGAEVHLRVINPVMVLRRRIEAVARPRIEVTEAVVHRQIEAVARPRIEAAVRRRIAAVVHRRIAAVVRRRIAAVVRRRIAAVVRRRIAAVVRPPIAVAAAGSRRNPSITFYSSRLLYPRGETTVPSVSARRR
jgi:hypothetical protein